MADEDITLDGKPLQSLRVADLKAALEQRNLPKSGQKNALIKRLKGALMLENLQKSSSSHSGLQPNSQIGEEMSQNSFIKQYLAKQQELLHERLEREAQQDEAVDESSAVQEEDEDHSEDNDSSSYVSDKNHSIPPKPLLPRAEERGGGDTGMMACGPDMGPGPTLPPQEFLEAPGARMQRATFHQGHKEPPAPSPPRAVASLSVRVLGQPDRQGLPPAVPRAQEKEGTAPSEPGSAHPVLHLSRSAGVSGGSQAREDSDDDDSDDESEDDEDWGPGPGGARRGNRAPPQQMPPSFPSTVARSKRKLQPPQHIPPPQVHHTPMQLRHPTPPPSPPPDLFPLPDTPKQSPPDTEDQEGDRPEASRGPRGPSFPPSTMQRQDSDSSSRSSSPEPSMKRRPGPLSLLAHRMDSEGAFRAAEATSAVDLSGEAAAHSTAAFASFGDSPLKRLERKRLQENRDVEEERRLKEEKEREQQQKQERERMKIQEQEIERERLEEEEKQHEKEQKRQEEEKERKRQEEEKERKRQEEEKIREEKLQKERKHQEEEKIREEKLQKEKERKHQEEEMIREEKLQKEKERKHQEEEKIREEKLQKEKERKHQEEEKIREEKLQKEKERKHQEEEKIREEKLQKEKERKHQEEKIREEKLQKEKERKHQEEEKIREEKLQKEKERKHQEEEKIREEKLQKEKERKQETVHKGRVAVTEAQDSGSSSDSESSSHSSQSSSSSSSSGVKTGPARQLKKPNQGHKAEEEKKTDLSKGAEKQHVSTREVSEPSAAAVTEVQLDPESSMAQQPPSGAEAESSEGRLEEGTNQKAFAARKISLTSSKTSPPATDGGAGDCESGTAAGRKRRWGSSSAVTTKKPSISITTDSLKSLIPDIRVKEEAVVELHPEELPMSGDEESPDPSAGDQDKGLKIRRTVTQVVPGDAQENGQTNDEEEEEEEEEEVEKTEKEKRRRTSRDKRNNSVSEEAMETQISVKIEGDEKKVTPSDSLVRRSISQQKSGVSVTIDDPVRTTRQPSPPQGKVSKIIHVTNLVRPFTLGQLKELLNRTGSVLEDCFWIDKIKSHCFVTYGTTEEAVATRAALHGVKWPSSNPKVLNVDFCEQDDMDIHKGILKPEREKPHAVAPQSAPPSRLPPLMPEREQNPEWDRGMGGVRELWVERQREMERRERARGEREWDRDKVREFARPGEDRPRSRSRERRRRERAKSKERKTEKKGDEPPAKLLDDLFLKTKAAPCIYWLPLSEEQAAHRTQERTERQKERVQRRKERQEELEKKAEEERERLKERLKAREKDRGVAAAVVASVGAAGRGAERERERGRDREPDRKRDGSNRPPPRPSVGAGAGRRSHSRSNPRDRRR
ncbi:apoptotic chromatin condensation inducer 1b isoform X2 [Pseudochaenichthys georgianus]|uniref:apoptotic chromatin condensation inducer 1b isoform X2 n=1 Tax=Pseudochaenichthys georgianus TaxID=52239 RepID=UPI00146BD36F|nr:apoptotic chromatin condensation inducer 1b isoform X2 [Pseudochaenichthys georgianus]